MFIRWCVVREAVWGETYDIGYFLSPSCIIAHRVLALSCKPLLLETSIAHLTHVMDSVHWPVSGIGRDGHVQTNFHSESNFLFRYALRVCKLVLPEEQASKTEQTRKCYSTCTHANMSIQTAPP